MDVDRLHSILFLMPILKYFWQRKKIRLRKTEETEHDRGGIGVMDVANNLTYMDILITPKTKGGGKGGVGSGGSGGGNDGNGFPGGGKGRN